MPRRPRIVHPGSIHHITARGIGRRVLFAADDDRRTFLRTLAGVVRNHDWTCHSYCLMGNHFHLVVQTGERGLAGGMHRLNALHAQRYNRLYGVTGHVFDRRYANQLVTEHQHLRELTRYVHLNPVRAGLCEHPSEWPWSSYRAIAGIDHPPALLSPLATLGVFDHDVDRARAEFVRHVEDGMAAAPIEPAPLARPKLLDLVRTLGREGGVLAHVRYGYPQRDVAAALGMSSRNFRRHLHAVSG